MGVAEKILALVESLRRDPAAFEAMAPERRRVLRETCRYIASLADPDTVSPPRSGVLAELQNKRES